MRGGGGGGGGERGGGEDARDWGMAKVSDCTTKNVAYFCMIMRYTAYEKVIMQGIFIMINACAATNA